MSITTLYCSHELALALGALGVPLLPDVLPDVNMQRQQETGSSYLLVRTQKGLLFWPMLKALPSEQM